MLERSGDGRRGEGRIREGEGVQYYVMEIVTWAISFSEQICKFFVSLLVKQIHGSVILDFR